MAGREQRCVVGIIPWGPCALSLEVAILARERHMQVADEYVAWIGYSRGGAAEGTEAAAHRFWEKVKGEGVGCPPARARAACLAACTHTRWGAGVGCCCLGAVGVWIGRRGSFGNGLRVAIRWLQRHALRPFPKLSGCGCGGRFLAHCRQRGGPCIPCSGECAHRDYRPRTLGGRAL